MLVFVAEIPGAGILPHLWVQPTCRRAERGACVGMNAALLAGGLGVLGTASLSGPLSEAALCSSQTGQAT